MPEKEDQGGQIWRIFAHWTICRFLWEVFFQITRIAEMFGLYFHGNCYALILTKNVLGYILGDFFTCSSCRSELED
jgi:hypothetical protein